MASSSHSLALVAMAVMCAALVHVAHAQNSRGDWIRLHNDARSRVGPVSWDSDLADYAQDYARRRARDCRFVYSGGSYGENIFRGSGREYTASDAVSSWFGERRYYDYNSNTCERGRTCRHYTQLVWRSSVRIGCARVRCDGGAYFRIMRLQPPGQHPRPPPLLKNLYYISGPDLLDYPYLVQGVGTI